MELLLGWPNNLLSPNSESFKYKPSITGNTCNVGDGEVDYDADKVSKNEIEIFVPLKFWLIAKQNWF